MLNPAQLTGKSIDHIAAIEAPRCELHMQVVRPFLDLRLAAREAGMDLVPASSFRSFDRQLQIWNAKYCGQRPMLDLSGRSIDAMSLAPEDRVTAILQWSALPGASRHHWGTDLDLIDRNAIPAGYRVELVAAEFEPGGPFAVLGQWLERNAQRYGFFKPYRGVLSGVAPEPWHWSFAAIAEPARAALTREVLSAAIENAPVMGKEYLLGRLPELHARFVCNIDPPEANA